MAKERIVFGVENNIMGQFYIVDFDTSRGENAVVVGKSMSVEGVGGIVFKGGAFSFEDVDDIELRAKAIRDFYDYLYVVEGNIEVQVNEEDDLYELTIFFDYIAKDGSYLKECVSWFVGEDS